MRKILVSVGLAAFMSAFLAYYYGWQTSAIVMSGLIIHESGHLIALVRNGVSIKGLYFIPFVGAVIVSEGVKDRWTGVKVTLAGPALGGCSAVLMTAAWYVWRDPVLAGAAFFFTVINAFNMLPVFPLDGGQALAYAMDDGKKPFRHAYLRMWILYALSVATIMIVMRSWFMGLLVAYYAFGAIKSHLSELARREDRERVRAALASTFGTTPELVCEAVEAPLFRMKNDEEPEFPAKLLEEHYDLAALDDLRKIDWSVSEGAKSPVAESVDLSEIDIDFSEDEIKIFPMEARHWVGRLDRHLSQSVRDAYLKAIREEGRDACADYRLAPGIATRVTHQSSFDPRTDNDGGSCLRSYLSGLEPDPIPAPLALRGRILYFALALGLGAMTLLTGAVAGWSLKALF